MEIDPATICARTGAGEVELAQARSGLTLPQRKALSLLAAPRAYAEFTAENHLDPERLARDFVRLAELGLITLQLDSVNVVPVARVRPESAPARGAPPARPAAALRPRVATPAADPQSETVVIGAAPGRSALKVAALAGAAVGALTAGWLALRDGPQATPQADAVAPHPAPVPVRVTTSAPAPALPEAPIPADSPNNLASPVFSNAAANRPSATDRKAAARDTGPAKNAVLTSAAETTSAAIAPASARPLPELAPMGERAPEPASPPPSPSASAPSVAPTAAPVLVATAARPALAAAPSMTSALQPIVKEAPEFPKEAMTEGLVHGIVKARVTVDASGKVAGIEIIDAQPRRIFDRAVRAALWRWQFEPGAPNRTAEVEIAFARP